jgi:hypothetical protein
MSSNRAALHGGDFMKSGGGRWATEQMIRALSANQPFTTDMLRVAETLRRDEWKAFDTAIIGAGVQRLRAVADLYAAGLVKNIANGFGKTIFEWETVNDMGPAAMSMDGMAKTDNERLDFDSAGVPLPIIHKDFFLHLRHLAASRNGGTPLDTMQAAMSGRVIAETVEDLLINGTDKVFRGLPIYGYTTYPYRNAINFGNSDQAWADAGKTGEGILTGSTDPTSSTSTRRRRSSSRRTSRPTRTRRSASVSSRSRASRRSARWTCWTTTTSCSSR